MKRIWKWVFGGIEFFITAVCAAMCAVVFFQIVLRYLLDQPFGWTEELGRILFLLFVMLGAVIAYRDDRHLGLDIVENRIPPRARVLFVTLKRVLVLVFAGVMIREGFNLVNSLYARTPILSVPFSTLYLIFPVTMMLIFILAVIQFSGDLRRIREVLQGRRPAGGEPRTFPGPPGGKQTRPREAVSTSHDQKGDPL